MPISGSENDRFWDLVAAMPVILLCVVGTVGFTIELYGQWPQRSNYSDDMPILSEATSATFLILQAALLCMRRLPVYKALGMAPRAWALMGAYFSYLLLLIPKATPSPAVALISSMLLLAGTTGSICTLIWLGKAFSILPQARQLVTDGPYRWVRHPLYLTEQLSALGLALQFRQPWGLLIVMIGFAMQFPRMHYEEETLAARFPDYPNYAAHTPRVVPFLLADWRFNGGLHRNQKSPGD